MILATTVMDGAAGVCGAFLGFPIGIVMLVMFLKALKGERERKLLEQNPQAWERLKSFELEKKSRQSGAIMKGAAGAGVQLAKLLLKK